MTPGSSGTTAHGTRLHLLQFAGFTMPANLLGAVLTYFYFHVIDPVTSTTPLRPTEITYFVVGFAALMTLGYGLGTRWAQPLLTLPPSSPLARRRALLLPYVNSGVTLMGWTLAGFVWGVLWDVINGDFSPMRSLRMVFGITCIAGTVTTAFVFFGIEHRWRKVLPVFFPEGDVSAVPALRLSVRTRLIVMFLMVSVIPLSLLGVLMLTTVTEVAGAEPGSTIGTIHTLVPVVLFIVGVGIVGAVGLAMFVSASVAGPLRALQDAMRRVERGNLDSRCEVVTTDELGTVSEGFNRMLHGLREREFVKETFGKYVTPAIRDQILAGRVALEGEAVDVTILFSDLRDFTPWVETTDAREVVADLNAYFTAMEDAIRRHGGLVLQYIGDEIEAVFGAPVTDAEHAEHAVLAALAMRDGLEGWNAARVEAGKRPMRHGIGIHTGVVLAGNIGSAERVSYALVGDAVNLASRIEGLTKTAGADILVSGATASRLGKRFALTELPAVKVKGRTAEVEVYRLG